MNDRNRFSEIGEGALARLENTTRDLARKAALLPSRGELIDANEIVDVAAAYWQEPLVVITEAYLDESEEARRAIPEQHEVLAWLARVFVETFVGHVRAPEGEEIYDDYDDDLVGPDALDQQADDDDEGEDRVVPLEEEEREEEPPQ